MPKSITETLRKINTELTGSSLLSILLSLTILTLFTIFKIFASPYYADAKVVNYKKSEIVYNPSGFSNPLPNTITSSIGSKNYANGHFIYASKRGKKYYYYNCRSTIKEANKIYFESDAAAKRAGYTLAKACQ